MFRSRTHFFPKTLEAYSELMKAGEEYSKLAAEKGWAEGTFWTPVVGEMEVVAEFDYPDLATYQRQLEEAYTEPRAMALMQRLMSMEGTRTNYDELLSTAPSFA